MSEILTITNLSKKYKGNDKYSVRDLNPSKVRPVSTVLDCVSTRLSRIFSVSYSIFGLIKASVELGYIAEIMSIGFFASQILTFFFGLFAYINIMYFSKDNVPSPSHLYQAY